MQPREPRDWLDRNIGRVILAAVLGAVLLGVLFGRPGGVHIPETSSVSSVVSFA